MRAIAATVGAVVLALSAAGCAGSGGSATTSTRPRVSLESPRARQIALTLASRPRVFSIFPSKPGRSRCLIPEDAWLVAADAESRRPAELDGWCTTRIHRSRSHTPALVVTFTEEWWPCPGGSFCPLITRLPHHTWQVIVRQTSDPSTSGLRVVATRERGVAAPQFYR